MKKLTLAVAALSLVGVSSAQPAIAAATPAAARAGAPVSAAEQLGGDNGPDAIVAIFGVLGTLLALLGATGVIDIFGIEDDEEPASP